MKRDMDVIVKLLLQLEAEDAGVDFWRPELEGVPAAVVKEHLLLMQEAGLVDFRFRELIGAPWSLLFPRLRNEGHDFLDAMRTPARRERVAEWAKRVGRAVTIDVVLAYVRSLITE